MAAAPETLDVPAVRRRRRRAASPHQRLLATLRLSAWMIALLAALATVATLLFLHRGDPEGSSRIANAEIELQLQRDERVERRVAVMQRFWWDYFRITHGVLAATDRRLLYVGVPPDELLRRDEEPRELRVLSVPYDRFPRIERTRVFLETRPGFRLRTGSSASELFGVTSRELPRLDSAFAIVNRRLATMRAAQEAERRAANAAMAASRRAIYHLVRRGEALASIAARYGTSADSLRVWNGLVGDRIKSGQRLLVKPAQ